MCSPSRRLCRRTQQVKHSDAAKPTVVNHIAPSTAEPSAWEERTAMYELHSVTKTYSRRGQCVTALCDTTLTIPDNDFVAVVGPSGSGKTTLLSLLGGMLAPTTGKVLLEGQSLYDLSVEARTSLR